MTEETLFLLVKFFKILIVLKRKFSFQFVSFICHFSKLETSDRQDFVKTPNFDGYDVKMTLFSVKLHQIN